MKHSGAARHDATGEYGDAINEVVLAAVGLWKNFDPVPHGAVAIEGVDG